MLKRVIISAGGTGGHIFPAVSTANELKATIEGIEILFVGAVGGMEMTLVPKSGYEIKAVPITGIMRRITLKNIIKNLGFPFRLMRSMNQAKKILKEFDPQIVVGFGGYASGPMGKVASNKGVPLVVCEQNAYPGITNKWLAKRAAKILLGNEDAGKYFQHDYIKTTGNPIRQDLVNGNREAGLKAFGLDPEKPVVLSLGGSLGAGPLNSAWKAGLEELLDAGIQLVWQTGKRFHERLRSEVPDREGLVLVPFIENMADAFASADLVVSRAGASTISELILLSKPAVIVPSPNVAEDHQTKNALSLVDKGAAVMVKDVETQQKLVKEVISLLKDEDRFATLKQNITGLEKHDAAKEIVGEILALVK